MVDDADQRPGTDSARIGSDRLQESSLWIVVATLVGHGVFDFVHHRLIENPGVPPWWPGFCLAFDVAAGGFLAVLLVRRKDWSAD